MDEVVIKVENLQKLNKIYDKPIDRLKESLNPFRRRYHKEYYALNDISFEIKRGQTIGIIGKNGSGKSTLLKIITGVLSPTSGNMIVKGKLSALLELGAGFNPEYSGMENIYLSGTIMGYQKNEIDEKLDEIINFADIGEYINQPVKMYSSGMFARLAFAVAISVNPDILVVDEILSVGDFMFQHKCFMKFRELQANGTTILLVSHSSQQIIDYCDRAILLDEGKIYGDSSDVEKLVLKYEDIIRNKGKDEDFNEEKEKYEIEDFEITTNVEVNEYRMGSHDAIISKVFLNDESNVYKDKQLLKAGRKIYLTLIVMSKIKVESAVVGISIKDIKGSVIWGDNNIQADKILSLGVGKNVITFEFNLNISPGEYLLYCGLADISNEKRIELDQRWPVKKLNVTGTRRMAEGLVYAPSKVFIEYYGGRR